MAWTVSVYTFMFEFPWLFSLARCHTVSVSHVKCILFFTYNNPTREFALFILGAIWLENFLISDSRSRINHGVSSSCHGCRKRVTHSWPNSKNAQTSPAYRQHPNGVVSTQPAWESWIWGYVCFFYVEHFRIILS